MKVCQILYSGLGGHGSVAFSLVEADSQRRWEHSLIFAGIEPVRPEYVERCKADAIEFAGVLKTQKNPLPFWREVTKALEAARPDVVLLHSNTMVLPVKRYCKRHGATLVGVEHNNNSIKTRSEQIASRLFMLLADAVVVLTDSYYNELRDLTGAWFRPAKTHIIPNGIDVAKFRPNAVPVRARASRIGMAARFSHSKDQAGLVRAFADFLAQNPEHADCTLLLAGAGDQLEAVKDLVTALDLTEKVLLPGNLGEEALVDFYQNLDLYVHASYGETMSTAIMQALACGIPTLASDVPGISNMLQPGETGLLYDLASPADFTAKLHTLLQEESLRQHLSVIGRQRAEQQYSQERMFAGYDAVLRALRP